MNQERSSADPLGNRVYRYDLVGDKLANPKLLLDLPALPGPRHNAGKMAIGPDNNLYVSIGDVDGSFRDIGSGTKAQNYEDGPSPDGRVEYSGLLKTGHLLVKGSRKYAVAQSILCIWNKE